MIRYYICPIIGTGTDAVVDPVTGDEVTPADPYRPALIDAVGGLNWSTDIPNRSVTDGAPTFGSCIVCVNTSQANHDLIRALPSVEDVLDGLLTAERTREELLATLRSRRFDDLSLAVQTAKRARHARLAQAHRTNPRAFQVRTALEDGDLEQWMDGLLQQQRRSALVRNLFVSA
jgi:hypothetical protein